MKKTLAAVALLGAFAGSAMADVTLYGRVDTGFSYTHAAGQDTVVMKTGQSTGNRWGLKGAEQIGDMTVGFQLESGFTADDGEDQEDRLWRREARVYVKGAYGELGLGRFGTLDSGSGSYDMYGGLTPFGTGYSTVGNAGFVLAGQDTRRDNAIAYVSPAFGGVKFHAMAAASTAGEGTHESDRYYGAGLSYKAGDLGAALIASYRDFGNDVNHNGKEDALSVTAAVNYNFGVAKVYVAGQYFDGLKSTEAVKAVTEFDCGCAMDEDDQTAAKAAFEGVKGYGLVLGADAPVAGGTLLGMVGFQDAEDVEGAKEYTAYQVGVAYKYPLSKKVYLYTAAGYTNAMVDDGAKEDKTEATEVIGGIVVNF